MGLRSILCPALAALVAWPAAAHPTFTTSSIVNAAGFQPPELEGGAIARGSIFTIFGDQLGPRSAVTAAELPLGDRLGDVRVLVSRPGRMSLVAPALFVSNGQINAIMPSDAPLGDATLQVEHEDGDGQSLSIPIAVRIVESSFGIFSIDGRGRGPAIAANFVSPSEQPLNSTRASARPGQLVTLWGTGLGAAPGGDRDAPLAVGGVVDLQEQAEVEVWVGGRRATEVFYAGRSAEFPGLDQITFAAPEDAPPGCYTPVWVRVRGGVVSNIVTLSIAADGGRCQDPLNPFLGPGVGDALGAVALNRLSFEVGGAADHLDTGTAAFQRFFLEGWFFNPAFSLPPAGTCLTLVERNGQGGLANQPPALPLEAGNLILRNDAGARFLPRSAPGFHEALLGQTRRGDAYLQPGGITLQGPGGADVGAFEVGLEQPAPLAWSLAGAGSILERAAGARVTWDGAAADGLVRVMLVSASTADPNANIVTTLACTAEASAGALDIPADALVQTPPSAGSGSSSTAALYVGRISRPETTRFEAEGLDYGFVSAATLVGRPVQVR